MGILSKWTQTLTIDGESALVHDTAINEQADYGMARISFTVEVAQNQAAYDAAVTGAKVVVTQTADGVTRTNEAEIRRVTEERGRNFTMKRIEARGLEVRAKGIRFQHKWTNTRASDVVTEAWNTYGSGLGYSLDIDSNDQRIDISSSHDTLFDLMQEITKRTNWAWGIDNDTVRFFDPLSRVSPAIHQGDQEIEGDTLNVERSIEQLVNVARTQGYIYRTKRLTVTVDVPDCRWAWPAHRLIPADESEWEVVGQPEIIQDYADLSFDDQGNPETSPANRSAELRYDDWIEFDKAVEADVRHPDIKGSGPTAYAELIVEVTHRRKVWFRMKDQDSIDEFGPREGQALYGDGGMGEAECRQVLSEHLARWSQPTIAVEFQPLIFGHFPDSLCLLTLTEPALSGTLYVTEVRRTLRGPELTVEIALASPQTVLTS